MQLTLSELDQACLVAHSAYGKRGVVIAHVADDQEEIDFEPADIPPDAYQEPCG